MSMHFAPQWLKQPIKPVGNSSSASASAAPAQAQGKQPATTTNAFPPLNQRPSSPYNSISYSHITSPTTSSFPPNSLSGGGGPPEGAHPFRYSKDQILNLFDANRFSHPPIELAHLQSPSPSSGPGTGSRSVIYSETMIQPIGLREVNEIEKRLLGTSVHPRLLRTAGGGKGAVPSGMMSPAGNGTGGATIVANGIGMGMGVGAGSGGIGHKRVPGSMGDKIEPPVRSSANNWRPSRTLSSSGTLASPSAGFEGVLGFGSAAPGPPTPTSANSQNGLQPESDAGPGWGSGNRRWRAAATAQERSSQSTMATPSATPIPERDATIATPAPAPAQPRHDTPSNEQQPPAKPDLSLVKWFYLDPSGNQQGPFGSTEMQDWYSLDYFVEELPVRRESESDYHSLRDLKMATGSLTAPFLSAVLPKAPPPMLPPNLPIPGFSAHRQPQPWGFPQPQQSLVTPFENLSVQHPFAPYQQHMPQPIYSPVIGGPAQRANGYYSPAVGVPLAEVQSPWGMPQVQQQPQPWQQPVPQMQPVPQQPTHFPHAQAPAPYMEHAPVAAPARTVEPVRQSSPVKQPEVQAEPVVEAVPVPAPVEPSPIPAPAPAAPAHSPWAKVDPVPEVEAAKSPVVSAPTPAAVATLPPVHASLPAKPAARQSMSVAAAATAESSPVATPAKAKAPWAASKEEEKGRASPVGPSLREIQQAEAKEASSRKAAERAAASSPAPGTATNGRNSPDLPQQMSWGLPSQSKPAPSPAATPAGPVWGGGDAAPAKKTLKQIQEEEEKRKAKVAAQAKAQAAASGNTTGNKRGYADLAAAPTAAASTAGGAWSTVGAGGKPSAAPPKPVAAPAKPVVTSVRPAAAPKKAVVDEQPSVEFIRWTKQALIGLSGVNVDEFIQMLLLFPIEPGAQRAETLEIIADSVYANSSTLDGRRFAQEFYTKRKADAQARPSAKISSLADVVKTQPKAAPTSDFGFKVVKAKGKGRK